MNIDQSIDFRSKCEHFRILVIGRANAGKTTLLRKVCRSTEDPRIFSPSGKRFKLSLVEGSDMRGLHDIENELIFKSNSQFIFHDSRGFESGSVEELDKVKTFLATRAATTDLSKQLHMIWYCLPTDTDRPILEADIQFFDVCGSGSVPVIAIFTKFDGLVTKAYNELRRGGSKIADAKRKGTEIAQQKLQTDFINTLRKLTKFHPSNNVQLGDVQKDETDCSELINITADAITNEGLKLLFVSVQQNNIACCVRYVIWNAHRDLNRRPEKGFRSSRILVWFPHVWMITRGTVNFDYSKTREEPRFERELRERERRFLEREKMRQLADICDTDLRRHLPPLTHSDIERVAVLCICLEQTFSEASVSREDVGPALSRALVAYVESPLKAEVSQQITELPHDQEPHQYVKRLCDIIKAHRLRINSDSSYV